MTRKRWKNPDKRMQLAVELRQRGYSLRRIGTELAVDEKTIRNDLVRWERAEIELLLRNSAADFRSNSARIPQAGEDQ